MFELLQEILILNMLSKEINAMAKSILQHFYIIFVTLICVYYLCHFYYVILITL